MTKRDLADLCLEGLLESTEQQQQDQLVALLQVQLAPLAAAYAVVLCVTQSYLLALFGPSS